MYTDEPQSYLVCNTYIAPFLFFDTFLSCYFFFFFLVFFHEISPRFLFFSLFNSFVYASFSQLLSMYIQSHIRHTISNIFLVAVLVFYLISLLVPLNCLILIEDQRNRYDRNKFKREKKGNRKYDLFVETCANRITSASCIGTRTSR